MDLGFRPATAMKSGHSGMTFGTSPAGIAIEATFLNKTPNFMDQLKYLRGIWINV
jgi:hypothetical protein